MLSLVARAGTAGAELPLGRELLDGMVLLPVDGVEGAIAGRSSVTTTPPPLRTSLMGPGPGGLSGALFTLQPSAIKSPTSKLPVGNKYASFMLQLLPSGLIEFCNDAFGHRRTINVVQGVDINRHRAHGAIGQCKLYDTWMFR